MCLFTNRKEPYIAKKDITVYKRLERTPTGYGYQTPYQAKLARLNCTLFPDEETPDISFSFNGYGDKPVWRIRGGVIHAYTRPVYSFVFKAVIPKGTEFWVDEDRHEICARKLFITDQEIPCKYVSTTKADKTIDKVVKRYERRNKIRNVLKKLFD